jgi:RimJ/RimL family protein N-acetyltransferase
VDNDFALRTDRLILRLWRPSDLEPFAAVNADPCVMEHFPNLLSRAESDERVARISQHFDQHGFGLWAIEVPNVAPFIGFAGLAITRFEAAFTPCIEIGWRIAHEYWGRGYAPEAATASLNDGFERFNFHEVLSFTVPANQRSRRVMEKLGMTYSPAEDFDHPNVPENHRLRRHVLYRLPRANWKSAP